WCSACAAGRSAVPRARRCPSTAGTIALSETRLVGAAIITENDDRRIVEHGEIAFDDTTGALTHVGEIRGSGGGSALETAVTNGARDLAGTVVLPGLVNAHTHSGMTPLRGYAEDMNLQDWLAAVREYELLLTADDLRAGLQLALVEMLRTGTTTFADMFL